MAVAADGLGGLQDMLDLRKIGIGIAVIHQGVEVVESLPDSHLAAPSAGVLLLLRQHEFRV